MYNSRYLTTWARRRSNAWVLGVLAVAAGVALALAFLWYTQPLPRRVPPEPPVSPESSSRVAATLESTLVPRIGPATQVVYRIRYAQTGEVVSEARAPEAEMLNLTLEGLKRLYPQYSVEEFSSRRVILARTVARSEPVPRAEPHPPVAQPEAPGPQTYRTIGLHEGYVAIFKGRPGTGASLLRVTSIPAERLPWGERERLTKGIEVQGDEEVAQYLEGYEE